MYKTLGDCCENNVQIIGYLETLEKRLKKSRFNHTLGVVETACKMAKHHGADPVSAMTAAALHDYAKNLTVDELSSYAQERQLEVDAVMNASGELLHGLVGAEMVKQCYGIDDEDILNAIRFHTTGRSGMSLLEQIVYLADAIEPGRSEYPGLKGLRKLAYDHLDAGVLVSVTGTLNYVLERGLPIHPNSVALYNELLMRLGESPKLRVK